MGPTILAWAMALLGDATTVDIASGAEVMVRGGAMAVVPNEAARPAMEYSLTTMSGIRISTERTEFTLRYRPLTYYQLPNVAEVRRPLYLHRLSGGYSTSISPRLNFNWSGEGRVGDVTYANLARTFEQGTTATAAARFPLLFLSTNATSTYATGNRNTVSVGSDVSYRSVMNTLAQSENLRIPETLNVGMTLSDTLALTRQDQVGISIGATYSHVDSLRLEQAGSYVFGTALLNWGHRPSPSSNTTLEGGLGATRGVEGGPTSLFPVLTAAHTNTFRWWGDSFNSSFSGGARGFVDPILATLRPQGFLNWSLTGRHTRLFSTQTGVSGFTSITSTPVEPARYESNGSLNFAGIFDLSPGINFRTGVAWQVRAPHLTQMDALIIQSQPTAFVALRGTIGTDGLNGSWL